MGSWDETDGVTQLFISPGDKCRIFFLLKSRLHSDACGGGSSYSNDFWQPKNLPILGEYADYGEIDNIVEDINSLILLDNIKSEWMPYEGTDEYKESITSDNLTLYNLVSSVSQDNGVVKNYYQVPQTLGLMFVHEDIYQAIINFKPIEADFSDRDNGFLYKPADVIINQELKTWYNNILDIFESSLSEDETKSKLMTISYQRNCQFLDHRFDIGSYTHFLIEQAKYKVPFSNPEIQAVCKGIVDFCLFNRFMQNSRKYFMPQSGKGSQANDTDIYKVLNKAVFDICKKRDDKNFEENVQDGIDWKQRHNEEELKKRALKIKENTIDVKQKDKQISSKKTR